MFEKITLFCISICIMKLINHKTQNNFFSTQIIVYSSPYFRFENDKLNAKTLKNLFAVFSQVKLLQEKRRKSTLF